MKKLYKEFFYGPKHAKVSDRVFKTRTILSFLTSFVCFVIFCSTTFAWFNCNRECGIQPIKSAELSMRIQSGEWDWITDRENHAAYTCPLAEPDNHSFTITNVGTASTGYCVINANGETFSTVQIGKGDSLTLNIQAAIGTEITFSANWGSYQNATATYSVSEGDGYPVYGDGDCIVISTTPYEVYTVAEGVTIEMLAEYYGVPAEEISSFNNITELIVGTEIKIPNTTVTEPFVLEEIPATEDVATPSNATPSDAEETVPKEDKTTVSGTEQTTEPTEPSQPTETEGEEITETTTSTEPEQTEESTEPETVPIETEAPTEETSADETEAIAETVEVIETDASSTDEITEPTSTPETTANEEITSATENETIDAQ